MSNEIMEGLSTTKTKKFRVKHPKRKLYRSSEPLLSVFMWGINHTVRELSHISIPVMLMPDDFRAYSKIKIDNHDNLEVTFATLRPKDENSPQFVSILCAVYSPPKSRKKSKLIDFISNTYHHLKSTKYSSAFFALGGDINDLKVEHLLKHQ